MSIEAQLTGELVTAEPIVRVGVVLAEDEKREIEFSVLAEGYQLYREGYPPVALAPDRNPFKVRADDGVLRFTGSKGTELLSVPGPVRLVPPVDAKPRKAGDGVRVREIVAGRGFHWFKLIDQTLSDTLEFQERAGNLILINALPLEIYLIGVITGEMSGECPIEFLKAQATAARSWLLGQKKSPHPGEPFFWCNDDCCQRYQGTDGWSERAIQAIDECRGQFLITHKNQYCDARYSKSTGGISEDASVVWPDQDIDGLEARVDAPKGSHIEKFFPVTEENIREYLTGDWLKDTDAYASPNVIPEDTIMRYLGRVDEAGTQFRWRKTVTQESLRESLVKRGGIKDLETVLDLRPAGRGKSGRLYALSVDYLDKDGNKKTYTVKTEYRIRAAMDVKFLYSGCFVADVEKDAKGALVKADLIGGGWGHGAGLCQIGGLGRALKGQGFEEILLHYYSKVELRKLYD